MSLDIKEISGPVHCNEKISIAVTTYSGQSYYTHACLESIRKWKTPKHELIVACHDQTPLLEYYLKSCQADGLIDKLIFTPHNYGHTMGVNKCFEAATGDVFFNIANDILIGPCLVDDCAYKLRNDKQIGLIGWHWYNDGTFYNGSKIHNYKLRDEKNPKLSANDEKNIRSAPWFTGKTFEALGGPYWLCLCNTAFFGIRKEVWQKVGGFSDKYRHYWADDFLNYAVLEQGLDVRNFEHKFRRTEFFHEFQYLNVDVEDRRRTEDHIELAAPLEAAFAHLDGGMSKLERQLLFYIAKTIPEGKTILNVGLWRGTSLFVFMEALKNKNMKFIGIDCFDDPEIAKMSAQPPVSRNEVISYMQPFIGPNHNIELIKANTLKLSEFPKADVIFLDAGHTKECIENDIKLALPALAAGGLLIFHDYNQPMWPDVTVAINQVFGKENVKSFGTLAIVQR
jgi:GT2 family glycosyltransferase/predicted O-methyltransferase YrrM